MAEMCDDVEPIVPESLEMLYDSDCQGVNYGLQPFSFSILEEPLSPHLEDPTTSSMSCAQQLEFILNVYENGAACTYSREAKMLFTTMDTPIHVTFALNGGVVPDGTSVVAVVWYRDEQHQQERGPVTRCLKHLSENAQCPDFITCQHPASRCGISHGHRYITVPLRSLQQSSEGCYHCSYTYRCMTSCLGVGKLKAELVTIFSLYCDGHELGREVVVTRVCSSPMRDRRKMLGDVKPQKRPCPSTPPPPQPAPCLPDILEPHPLLEVEGGDCDEDGYYSFTWKTKDRGLYNILQLMKLGYEIGHPPS